MICIWHPCHHHPTACANLASCAKTRTHLRLLKPQQRHLLLPPPPPSIGRQLVDKFTQQLCRYRTAAAASKVGISANKKKQNLFKIPNGQTCTMIPCAAVSPPQFSDPGLAWLDSVTEAVLPDFFALAILVQMEGFGGSGSPARDGRWQFIPPRQFGGDARPK